MILLKLASQTSQIFSKVEKEDTNYYLCFYTKDNLLLEKFECVLEYTEDSFSFYTKATASTLPEVFKLGSGYFFNKHIIKIESKNKKVSHV